MEEDQNIQADIARNHEDSASSPFLKTATPPTPLSWFLPMQIEEKSVSKKERIWN